MAVSTTAATIPKAGVAAMTGSHIPVALLQIATTNQQCTPISFVADIDRAEKGIPTPAIHPNTMKRATTAKDNAAPSAGNPNRTIEKDQASTTGADRYPEGNRVVEDSTTQELNENIEAPQIPTRPTATSSVASGNDGTSSTENKPAKTQEGSNSNIQDTGYERFIDRSFESYPPGVPQLAAFLNSAESFAIARRFGTAHARLLLHLSCEITALEKQLDQLDEADSKTSTKYRLHRIDYHQGWDPGQKELIDKLKLKLSEYDDLLLKDSALRALPSAPVRDHLSVFHWIYNNKPLDPGHYDFIYHLDDFVSLGKQSQSRFDDLIKACLNRWPSSHFQRFFRDGNENESHGRRDKHVFLFSSDKISRVAKIMAICLAVTILLIPVFLLFLTHMSRKTTAVMVLAFVLAFATLVSVFTEAKAENVFIGTCTYCAVLVTFLGNLQGTVVATGSS